MWGTLNGVVLLCVLNRFIPTHVGNTQSQKQRRSIRPVHPHACGEHFTLKADILFYYGSSPRMWGTPDESGFAHEPDRFIPTHVGNTLSMMNSAWEGSVHPHACGEHIRDSVLCRYSSGSSPRMWGTPDAALKQHGNTRFIPTHVGNTALPPRALSRRSVHPHACGEHKGSGTLTRPSPGSSPRMWGTLHATLKKLPVVRFIPTHVGNT